MIKDITVGQFFPGQSLVHRLDPRTKIILTFIFIVVLFIVRNFSGYIFVAAFIIIPALISKVPIKYLVRGLRPLLLILIFTVVVNAVFTPGETVLYSIGSITVTKEGLRQAGYMGLRLIFLVLGTSLLTLTTSPIALTDGIEHLLSPLKALKFPAHELAMMMTIALRFIPTLLEETDKIMKAQMARGADFGSGGLLKRARGLVPLLVPLFISAFRRADELAMAMEARCYRGGVNRTRLKVLKFERTDIYAVIFMLVIILGVVWDSYLRVRL
ncbi:MAG TPA: energy-coupling factor transporter transmembrane protein EcfT [Clostridiales bacterium]|nr:energy-coupling factor transporter transmembrane protein EcfT [Clostridiales bacterium]